jgi:hypothetical protein
MLRYKYVFSFGSVLLVGLRKQGKRDEAIDYGAKGCIEAIETLDAIFFIFWHYFSVSSFRLLIFKLTCVDINY